MLVQSIMGLVAGYCIGSIPTAYLLLKWRNDLDIRQQGSGNVGARNAYEVSGSRSLGVAVFLIDLLKGAAAVAVSYIGVGRGSWIMASCGIGAVVGHNYSLWIGFRGGRGLATAAGVMALLGWVYLVAWCLFWLGTNIVAKDVHIANVTATVLTLVALFFTPEKLLHATGIVPMSREASLVLGTALCMLVLLRHVGPISEMLKTRT